MIERRRRIVVVIVAVVVFALGTFLAADQSSAPSPPNLVPESGSTDPEVEGANTELASAALAGLEIKGRAAKTGYAREQFGVGWATVDACDMRQFILVRDLESEVLGEDGCTVLSGTLNDPYTAKTIEFKRGQGTSDDVQIDHVVALSDAWQKGAQKLDVAVRTEFANDPLNLLAVDGPTNQKKSDSDAASWLPPNKDYRCRYVARQIAVKFKYHLWVTQAEHDAMAKTLATCLGQKLPSVQ